MEWRKLSDKVIFVTICFVTTWWRILLLVEASPASIKAVVSVSSQSSSGAAEGVGLKMEKPGRASMNWNTSLSEGVGMSFLQVPAAEVLTLAGGTRPASAPELALLLSQTVQIHLPGCQKVVLYKPSSNITRPGVGGDLVSQLVEDLVSQLGRDWEDTWLWELDTFLDETSPTYNVYRKSHRSIQGEYCIAFIILADLDSVGAAFTNIQKGSWFEGSTKYTLAFSGDRVTPNQVFSHRILRASYNLVVASQALPDNPAARGSLAPRVYQMIQVCPYCASGSPQVKVAALWSPSTGFLKTDPLFPDLFQNFQGHQFRVVTLVYEPFSCYHKDSNHHITPADNCVDNNMLREIAATLNFTYVIMEPGDGQWGYRLQNGSYTGVIGAVERMEADFSLNVAITEDREEKVDCTIGYHIEPITFATSKARLLNQALALLRPFTYEVWLAFAATLVLAGPFYYVVCRLSSRGVNTLTPTSAVRVFFYVYGACFNQSIKWMSEPGARIFMLTYVLTMFVTTTVYVAMLTATLTLPTLSPTLNFLQELVESDFTWGIQDLGAADYQLLKTSEVPLYQRVYRGLKPCPSLDDCITKARDSKFAFITWRTYLEDRIAVRFTSTTGERQLHVATGDIFPVELGWAMNPGCPYRRHFNHKIRSLLQSGLVAKWLRDLINDPQRREADSTQVKGQETNQALGMNHLQGVFFLLVMGHCLSCLAFVCEVTLSNTSSP